MSVLPDSREVFYRLTCKQENLPVPGGPPLPPFFHVQAEGAFRLSAMGGGARPRPRFGSRDHSRADRIPFHVPECDPQVCVVQRTGVVSALPDVPARGVRGIPKRGIPPVRLLQCQRQRLRLLRNQNQMHVIGHQAVAKQG